MRAATRRTAPIDFAGLIAPISISLFDAAQCECRTYFTRVRLRRIRAVRRSVNAPLLFSVASIM